MDRAESFAEVGRRDIKKVPTLRGRTIVNLFYESSTRTQLLVRARRQAALRRRRLGQVGRLLGRQGRVAEGHDRDPLRLRPGGDRDPLAARRRRRAGRRAGPRPRWSTPATASTSTRARRCSTSTRCASASARSRASGSGSSATSSTAASPAPCLLAFRTMGAEVTVCGPPTLIPRGIEEALGCEVAYDLDGLGEADVVYALRMQRERMSESFVPSIREYAARYQIDSRRLGPRQLLMHPGPVNRGVELSAEVIDAPQLADHRAGRERPGGADGDPLRAARGRRPRPGARARRPGARRPDRRSRQPA